MGKSKGGGFKLGLGGFLPRKIKERNKALKEAEEFGKGGKPNTGKVRPNTKKGKK